MFIQWKHILLLEKFAFVIGLGYYIWFVFDPYLFSKQTHAEDPMAVAGFGLLFVFILVAQRLQRRFPDRLSLMFKSGAIQLSDQTEGQLIAWFHHKSVRAFILVMVTLVPLYWIGLSLTPSNPTGQIHLYIGGTIGLCMVCIRFAYGVASGITAARISDPKHTVFLAPHHPDNSSGFGPLGHYYFEQALALLMPAMFMLFWMVYVGINIDRLARTEISEQVAAIAQNEDFVSDNLAVVLENYITCENTYLPVRDCPRKERSFLWANQFSTLIAFNLIIFMLSWVLPSIFLRARMRDYRTKHIVPKIENVERQLKSARIAFHEPEIATKAREKLEHQIDTLVHALASLRNCPTFPLPIWTVLTALISNISAIIGLLGGNLLP